ncbi:MAG: permease-like cell division protein FtsX [Oscillospiraceae bacterium]|nr:permease-like cell division protein FtsX [Oscillospiraceae bacterium]
MRASSAVYLFKQGIRNIGTNHIMSIASFFILTVSLLLIGFTAIFYANINSFITDIEGKNEVIIFLDEEADDEYIEQLGEKLKNTDNISGVSFYSKEEAFEDIKKDMVNAEDIFGYIGDESPLPDAYRIKIDDVSRMSNTLYTINSFDHIEKVKAPYDFVNILTGLRSIISVILTVILVLLIVVSLIIISNTTRASVDIRRREIDIMKFVGATNTFIKIPFFVEGFVIGLGAGTAAVLITCFFYDKLVTLLSTETTLLAAVGSNGFIPLDSFLKYIILGYLISGAVISAAGIVHSTRKYVKV